MISTAITFPAEQYVARGVCSTTEKSTVNWADTFKALGGERCTVIAGWSTRIDHTMTALVSGTPESVEFVLTSLSN